MLGERRPFEADTTQKLLVAVARDTPAPLEGARSWPLVARMLARPPTLRSG
jgi:hypothetical protein